MNPNSTLLISHEIPHTTSMLAMKVVKLNVKTMRIKKSEREKKIQLCRSIIHEYNNTLTCDLLWNKVSRGSTHIITNKYSYCSVFLRVIQFSSMLSELITFFGDFHVEFMSYVFLLCQPASPSTVLSRLHLPSTAGFELRYQT